MKTFILPLITNSITKTFHKHTKPSTSAVVFALGVMRLLDFCNFSVTCQDHFDKYEVNFGVQGLRLGGDFKKRLPCKVAILK